MKPWDSIRRQPQTAIPIGDGTFAINGVAAVGVEVWKDAGFVDITVAETERIASEHFDDADSIARLNASELRLLAEFCTELADQLEAK